jgi:hypothetical protein
MIYENIYIYVFSWRHEWSLLVVRLWFKVQTRSLHYFGENNINKDK